MVDVIGMLGKVSMPSLGFLSIGFFWSLFKMTAWLLVGWLIATIFIKYRYIVVTRMQRGVGQKIKIALAKKVVQKDGITYLKILGKKQKVPLPQNDFLYPAMMGFEFVELYDDVGNNLHPIKFGFADGDGFLYPVEQDSKSWLIQGTKETMQIYNKQNWMGQYGQLLGLGIISCVLLITVIVCMKQVENAIAMGNSVTSMAGQVMGGIKAPPVT